MNEQTQADIEELIAQLDAKYTDAKWDVYRAAIGGWAFKPGQDTAGRLLHEIIVRPTFVGCLIAALEFRILPRYRAAPGVFDITQFTVKKDGSKWEVQYGGRHYSGNISTKREAENFTFRLADRSKRAQEEWDATVGPLVAGKVAGVDFEYVDY